METERGDHAGERAKLAEQHFKAFIKRVHTLLQDRESFDLVVAPYNSGAAIASIASAVAARHGHRFFEPTLFLPVFSPYRFSQKPDDSASLPYDNMGMVPGLRAHTAGWPVPRRILFMDDEIGNGTAFSSAMAVCQHAFGLRDEIFCTIVAEENGFRTDYSLPGVRTDLRSFARRPSPDVSGILFHIVPEAITSAFSAIGIADAKQIVCTLMDLPVKALERRMPYLSNAPGKKAQRLLPGFKQLREQFLACVHALADEAWASGTNDEGR